MKTRFLLIIAALGALLLAACSGNSAVPSNVAPTLAAGGQSAQQTIQAAAPTIAANAQSAQQTLQATAPTIVAFATQAAPTVSALATQVGPTVAAAATAAATTVSGAAPSGNPGDAIVNAEKQFLTKPVRMTSVTTDSDTNQPKTTVLEIQPPDRFHMVPASGTEIIIVGGQGTWIKQGGNWIKSPLDMSGLVSSFYSPDVIQKIQQSVQLKPAQFVGPDILDGQPMWVYQYSTTLTGAAPGGGDLTTQSKIWIGAVDGLPHKTESNGPSATKQGVTTHTVITYQYDPNLNIQPPQ